MSNLSIILKYFVFVVATNAIAGLVNEGMTWNWSNMVGVFIGVTNVSFVISTLVNLFVDRKTKWIYVNIFSVFLIIVVLVMELLAIAYPIGLLVFGYSYIWFAYGIQITCIKEADIIS